VSTLELHHEVSALLNREARLLDAQQWHDWLELYCEDAVLWAPAYTMEGSYTTDPELELNLLYIKGRAGLEDRVFRLGTQLSLASTPLPRTRHFLSLITLDEVSEAEIHVFANAQVVWYSELRGQQVRASSYEMVLRRADDRLRIRQKKILLLESAIDGYFDFYGV